MLKAITNSPAPGSTTESGTADAPDRRMGTRFAKRRQAVLDAAAKLINRVGLGDTTLALVAAEIGLNLKSLRYYFEKREDLIVAAFLQSIELHHGLVARAMHAATSEERVRSFVRGFFDLLASVRRGERPEFTSFSDLRALPEPHSAIVYEQYNQFFREARSLLRPTATDWKHGELNARTHMLISQLLWSVAWVDNYIPEDFDRVTERFAEVLLSGLGTRWLDLSPSPDALRPALPLEGASMTQESFLRVATALINDLGHRGASIERISAVLNVSRGAFYHHYEARDELVVACFDRTFDVLRRAQSAAMGRPVSGAEQVAAAAVELVSRQFTVEGFMLRTTALTVVGPELRRDMTRRMSLATFRFQDMLSDGVADGSVRPLDLRIAAEMVTAMVNSAAELARWVPEAEPELVSDLYVRPLFAGLLSTSPTRVLTSDMENG